MEIKDNLTTGDQIEVQLCTLGEVPNTTSDGEEIIQKFTKEAFDQIIAKWEADGRKPIRVDIDHQSELTDNTEAAGWIEDLWTTDDGLWGKMTVSELGAEELNGLNYRYGSPAFILDESGTPIEMTSFALTNRPRLKDLKPVWNSSDKNSEITTNIRVNTDIGQDQMEKLIEILGLPAEATEEEVYASIKAMMDKLADIAKQEAEQEAAEAEKKLEEEAEEVLDGCDIDEETKEKAVNSFKANPEAGRLFASIFKAKSAVVNFDSAKKPEVSDITDFQKQLDALPGGEARVNFIMNYKPNK